MKGNLLCIMVMLLFHNLNAQQEEYTTYLEQALEAVNNKDEKNFHTNLKYFSVAMERDKITPEILSKKNLELYTDILYNAVFDRSFTLSDETIKGTIDFIRYDIENKPKNMFSLGRLYIDGLGVEKDGKKAVYWLEKAANQGESVAMGWLGYIYGSDFYDMKDLAKAEFWLEKGASKGDLNSIVGLAELLKNQGKFKDAKTWYEKAAQKGDAYSMHEIGLMYYAGYGVSTDYKKAQYWFKLACEKSQTYKSCSLYEGTTDLINAGY